MRALGVDLASQPPKTSCAVLEWHHDRVTIAELHSECDDEFIVELAEKCTVVGIDAPFGWPVGFRELITDDEEPRPEPEEWTREFRDSLRFRKTDFAVRMRLGRWPLSVSTDLIGVPALRCRGLLRRLGVKNRAGDGRVYETYPAFALKLWGLPSRGYKGTGKRDIRVELWDALAKRAPWLRVEPDQLERMHAKCDDLDAVVAALVAAAARRGAVEPLDAEAKQFGAHEGWIVTPKPDALAALAPPWGG